MKRVRRLLFIGMNGHAGCEVVRGINAYCRQRGANWAYHYESNEGTEGIKRVKLAIEKWKAQVVIARAYHTPRVIKLLKQSGLPVVNISGVFETGLPTVVSDSVAVGRLAAQHFLDSGLRNFAFAAQTTELYSQRRLQGFAKRLSESGSACAAFTDKCNLLVESDWADNRRRMDAWLVSLKKPVALMCMTDLRGQEVACECQYLGLRVPDDVAIVGVGNEEFGALCTPPLSTVDPDMRRIGFEAARLLDHLVRGGAAAKADPRAATR